MGKSRRVGFTPGAKGLTGQPVKEADKYTSICFSYLSSTVSESEFTTGEFWSPQLKPMKKTRWRLASEFAKTQGFHHVLAS
jgi:hypothetical protein